MPITIQLDEEQLKSRGRDLLRLIEQDVKDRQHALAKRQIARNLYYGTHSNSMSRRGAAHIHLPVLEEKVEGMVPKLSNAFHGADPIVHVQRVAQEFDEKATDDNERFLNWAVDSDIPSFYDVTECWFRNMLLDGVSVVKIYWERTQRNTVEISGRTADWRKGETDFTGQPIEEDRPRTILEVMIDHFPQLSDVRPEEGEMDDMMPARDAIGKQFRVDFVEDRREYVEISVEVAESEFVDEVDLYVYRPIIDRNRPRVDVIEYEDLILPYRTWDLQEAPRVTHRYWLTLEEFKIRAEQDGWQVNEEDWDKLALATRSSDRTEREPEDRGMSRQKDAAAGESPSSGGGRGALDDPDAPYVDGSLMMYEVYATEDLNKDGSHEEVIYQIPKCLKKAVKVQYLEELFPHGRRPFAPAHYLRISDRWYSRSLGEQLTPINLEVNAIVNMVNEAQELINNPFFFYVPHANTVDPEILSDISPGEGIPVSDVNAVFFPKFPQEPLANLSAVDSMLLFADRLTISPQAAGGSNQTRNAPRTARGTLALLSESGIKTDVIITGLQKGGWKEVFHQLHKLYHAFGDQSKWFRVTGETRPRRITPEEMRGHFDYTFHGNSVNTNREVLRSIAQMRYSTLIVNPLYSQDMNAMLALTEDFLRHFGEGTDPSKLMPKLPGMGGTHAPMDQRTENQIMGQGRSLEALPMDDHPAHLRELESFQRSPVFDSLPQWAVGFIAMHAQQHMQFMQQQAQAQGGGVPTGGGQGGMANNMPHGMGQQQDMNAMEGGVQ